MALKETEWHPVPGYEGRYEACVDGRIRRLARYINAPQSGGFRLISPRIVRTRLIRGYPGFIATKEDGRKTALYVHRVIAMLFVPNPDSKPNVNHIDGDKTNFAPANLEWVTQAENVRHALDNGFFSAPESGPGEKSPAAKLTWAKVGQIRALLAEGHRHIDVARKFGVSKGAIGFINRNETWRVEP